jgi:hypothetical protein
MRRSNKLLSGLAVVLAGAGLFIGGGIAYADAPVRTFAASDSAPVVTPAPVQVKITNAPEGVYWRSTPDWTSAVKQEGAGVYNGDTVGLECWVRGGTVPEMNNNPLWYRAKVVSGRGKGEGLVNDHFLATGLDQPNVVISGVPSCADSSPTDEKSSTPSSHPSTQPTAPSTQPKKDPRDTCMRLYPHINQTTAKVTGGTATSYDRAASLYQVCEGFGSPSQTAMPPAMKCAVIAAIATFGGEAVSGSVDKMCEAQAVLNDLSSGPWWDAAGNYAKGEACGYWSDLFARGAGIVIAGEASATGPGAVAVGVRAYHALAAGLKVACGGIFDGGASTVGQNLESSHESDVMGDIVNNGKCLHSTTRFGVLSWSAAQCG